MKFQLTFIPEITIQNFSPDFEVLMKYMYKNKCMGPMKYPATLKNRNTGNRINYFYTIQKHNGRG